MSDKPELTELSFSINGHLSKPRHEVYEAVADPDQLSKYFTTGGAQGRMESGATVTWDFHDFPGAFPVRVLNAVQDEKLVFQWGGNETLSTDGMNTVTFEFAEVDDGTRTKVTIAESSWNPNASGAKAAFGNCEGWTGMLAAMKCWVEYGINLREGFHK
ncbi:SRPBCC domain-containing protein [Glutamicibacter sp.]|uniref:SRPBCC domain-containing protein n=1 Tax=Glutamicibacter sp. TaxID=1931995 RepID=UPI0028BF3EE3|nr:SRPBCC domain-containing protein [Glutamicibacter sp.]